MLTALSAGNNWGTTIVSKYCLLVIVLGSAADLDFLLSGSSPAMLGIYFDLIILKCDC